MKYSFAPGRKRNRITRNWMMKLVNEKFLSKDNDVLTKRSSTYQIAQSRRAQLAPRRIFMPATNLIPPDMTNIINGRPSLDLVSDHQP